MIFLIFPRVKSSPSLLCAFIISPNKLPIYKAHKTHNVLTARLPYKTRRWAHTRVDRRIVRAHYSYRSITCYNVLLLHTVAIV